MESRKRSNRNAVTHGVFCQVLLDGNAFGEDTQNFVRLSSMLRESLRPVGDLEQLLVEKLAILLVRMTRLYRADLKLAPKLFERIQENLGPSGPVTTSKWISRPDEIVVVQRDPSSDLLVRYEAHLERQFARALAQIEALQRLRSGSSTPRLPSFESGRPDEAPENRS